MRTIIRRTQYTCRHLPCDFKLPVISIIARRWLLSSFPILTQFTGGDTAYDISYGVPSLARGFLIFRVKIFATSNLVDQSSLKTHP